MSAEDHGRGGGAALAWRVRALTASSRSLRRLEIPAAAVLTAAAAALRLATGAVDPPVALALLAVAVVGLGEWVVARRRARAEALAARIGALADSGQPLSRVLDGILGEMARTGLRGASIALVNENDELYIAAAEGELSEEVRQLRLPVGRGIMGTVALTGRPVVVDDLDRPAGDMKAANRTVGSNRHIRSMVAVPIRLDGGAFGVLEVDSREPHRFSVDDVALLGRVAAAISGAILRAGPLRLANEQLRRRVQELARLQSAARALNASLDVETVAAEVLGGVAAGLAAPVAAILRRDGEALRVAALLDGRAISIDGLRVSGEPVAALLAAIDAGRPLELAAGALGGTPELSAVVSARRLRIALVAPLRWPGPDPDALLVAVSPADRTFDAAERSLLEGIAHLAGLALGNAERYRRLEVAASTDGLTGLVTAQAFERALVEPHPRGLAVVAVDVDRLKEVNDVAGHEAGDETLRRVAAALRAAVDSDGLVGRTGGDEFAVLLDGADEEAAADLAERIRLSMHGVPVPHGVARVSVGVAAEEQVVDARQVWWSAAEAAGTARMWGGDGVIRAGTLGQPSSIHRRWGSVLGAILEGGRGVVSVYQPVVRLEDRGLAGYEALARPHDQREAAVDGLFAVAQRAGRGRDLDWVCRRAALDGARRLRPGTPLFVNVGMWALIDPLHPVDQMVMLLEWAGRSPHDVILELTERDLVSDLPRLVEVLATYRAEGFRFAVDDIGEGHSTLEVLSRADPEYIKLAKTLTAGRHNRGTQAAVAAVVTFAERSGATVIAEGIETGEEVDYLQEMGVELGQGWWLGLPGDLPDEPTPDAMLRGRQQARAQKAGEGPAAAAGAGLHP